MEIENFCNILQLRVLLVDVKAREITFGMGLSFMKTHEKVNGFSAEQRNEKLLSIF